MILNILVKPTVNPLSLEVARRHLRIDSASHDATLEELIAAAYEEAEMITGRAICEQTLEFCLDRWPTATVLELPRPPLRYVSGVSYVDTAGASLDIPLTDYHVDTRSEPGRIVLADQKTWPTVTLRTSVPITIIYTAGWAEVEDIPQSIVLAMAAMVGHWFEHPGEPHEGLPAGIASLLSDRFRRYV